jgi:hypothetical protein
MSDATGEEPSDRGRIQSCPLTGTLRSVIANAMAAASQAWPFAEYSVCQAYRSGS